MAWMVTCASWPMFSSFDARSEVVWLSMVKLQETWDNGTNCLLWLSRIDSAVWQWKDGPHEIESTLAGELRRGYWWQFANERLIISGRDPGFEDKSIAGDDQLLKAASTCMDCRRSAPHGEVRHSLAKASDMKSFLKLIGLKIEHKDDCDYK